MDALFIDKLWTPDLYFYNTRAGRKFVPTIFIMPRTLKIL